jgi:acyl carrier protein
MPEQVERRLRTLVADRLGVGEHELERHVSLRDDLAVDSLDLAEVAAAIEDTWNVTLPDRLLAQVRTYGELTQATLDLVFRRRRLTPRGGRRLDALAVRARITSPGAGARATLERTELLTPYAVEAIAEDALRAGPGAELHLTLPATSDDASMHQVRERFAWLTERQIEVGIARARVPARIDVQGRLAALEA